MATEGVDRMRENDEFDKKHPGKRKEQVLALKKRKQDFAKKISPQKAEKRARFQKELGEEIRKHT